MKPRFIHAFFNGTCRACGKKVLKGESAWFAKHYGIRCQACGPHTSADTPLPSKKGKSKRRAAESSPIPSMIREVLQQKARAQAASAPSSQTTEAPKGTGF